MTDDAPALDRSAAIDYEDGAGAEPDDYPALEDKLEKAIDVVATALETYDAPAVLWTGGKDSTLVLYLVKEVVEEEGFDLPPAVFIDHFQHFEEATDFVDRWADRWDLDLRVASNDAVGELANEPGDTIAVDDLDDRNRREVRDRLDYEEDTFPFLLDTLVGNHLLKTVPMNDVIEREGYDAVFSGVRWDEQAARSDETFFSSRHDAEKYPPHDRVHPILPFEERTVWDATWRYLVPETVEGYPVGHVPASLDDLPTGIEPASLPINPKYFEGFRSLGSEVSTARSDDRPAWIQDLEGTVERAGRAQDKEDLMERLRDLGYM